MNKTKKIWRDFIIPLFFSLEYLYNFISVTTEQIELQNIVMILKFPLNPKKVFKQKIRLC